jgi:hypothetical protein
MLPGRNVGGGPFRSSRVSIDFGGGPSGKWSLPFAEPESVWLCG